MAITQGVKVRVNDLIEAIEFKRKKIEETYNAENDRYLKEVGPWRKKVIKLFEAKIKELETVDTDDMDIDNWSRRSTISISVGDSPPSKPAVPNFVALDRDLALLRISADGELLVKTDSQYGQYL